jgi:hypothetical protein
MGAMRHFLAPKPRGATTLRRKAERLGIEFRSAIPEISPK